ncbi:hypothetical protein Gotur_025757, partial [Gossypium turneri]
KFQVWEESKLIFFFGFRYRHEAIDFPLSSSVLRDDMLRLIKVEEFFNLFFPDNAVNFIESFHRRCGDKETPQEISDVPYGDYFRVEVQARPELP